MQAHFNNTNTHNHIHHHHHHPNQTANENEINNVIKPSNDTGNSILPKSAIAPPLATTGSVGVSVETSSAVGKVAPVAGTKISDVNKENIPAPATSTTTTAGITATNTNRFHKTPSTAPYIELNNSPINGPINTTNTATNTINSSQNSANNSNVIAASVQSNNSQLAQVCRLMMNFFYQYDEIINEIKYMKKRIL